MPVEAGFLALDAVVGGGLALVEELEGEGDPDGLVDGFEALFDEIGGVVDLEVEVAVSTRSWGWKRVTKS